MSTQQDPSDEIIPGTVFNARQVRLLKIIVIAMGLMLVAGFVLVIATIVYQAIYAKQEAEISVPVADDKAAILSIDPGANVADMVLDGKRAAIHLTGPAGSEIVIIAIDTGRVIKRIRLQSE